MKSFKNYRLNGEQVVLIYLDEMEGIEPLAAYDTNYGVYALTPEIEPRIEAGELTVGLTYEDSYGAPILDEEEEIDYRDVQNMENEQRLAHEWVSVEYAKQDEAHRMLCVTTDEYYDWTSDRAEMLDRMWQARQKGNLRRKECEEEWEEITNRYGSPFDGDDTSFDALWAEFKMRL